MGVAYRNFRFVTLHFEFKSIHMMIVACDKTVIYSSMILGCITASNIHLAKLGKIFVDSNIPLPRSGEYLAQISPSQAWVDIYYRHASKNHR